jgi:uncharacterized protein YcbX
VGVLRAVLRYPVKSMLGERLPAARVDAAGVAGDRRLALVHRPTGLVASAKNPRRWRGLLGFTATGAGPEVHITAPGGSGRPACDPGVHEWLSGLLGHPVDLIGTAPAGASLERAVPDEVLARGPAAPARVESSRLGTAAPPGTFFDYAALHLVTTATLARIGAAAGGGPADPVRYRPNLVLDTGTAGFAENDWAGRTLRIGPDLVLRVLLPTPRCAVPTLAHGDLRPDPDALRVPARHNRVEPLPGLGPQPCVGAYATVLSPGSVQCGDPVRLS